VTDCSSCPLGVCGLCDTCFRRAVGCVKEFKDNKVSGNGVWEGGRSGFGSSKVHTTVNPNPEVMPRPTRQDLIDGWFD